MSELRRFFATTRRSARPMWFATVFGAVLAMGCHGRLRSEATDELLVISAIRIAQEERFAAQGSYISASRSLEQMYPTTPDGHPHPWANPEHDDYELWRTLVPMLVESNEVTLSGFAVFAGVPGELPPDALPGSQPSWLDDISEPWYVIHVEISADASGSRILLRSTSDRGDVHVERQRSGLGRRLGE